MPLCKTMVTITIFTFTCIFTFTFVFTFTFTFAFAIAIAIVILTTVAIAIKRHGYSPYTHFDSRLSQFSTASKCRWNDPLLGKDQPFKCVMCIVSAYVQLCYIPSTISLSTQCKMKPLDHVISSKLCKYLLSTTANSEGA